MHTLSKQAQALLIQLTEELGSTFSLKEFREFIELQRNKPLIIEELDMCADVSGAAISLDDCDLMYIARGLDSLSHLTSCLHEAIHVLRNEGLHVEDITYEQFQPCRAAYMQNAVYRSTIGEEASLDREHDAKMLERILVERVLPAERQQNQYIRSFCD